MIMVFQQIFMYSYFMLVWMKNLIQMFFCEITWMDSPCLHEWKWDNEFICNIWLSTSSSLIIVWMVLEVYLQFAVYCDDYKIFTNILFNHLISISKWDFSLQYYSLGFELLYSKYHLQKNFFTMNLVEAQKQVILKSNICDNNLWPS